MDDSKTGFVPNSFWSLFGKLELEEPLEEDEKLVLYLEEVEQMRPATYPNEPVSVEMFAPALSDQIIEEDYLVESGPRFSCSIDLTGS